MVRAGWYEDPFDLAPLRWWNGIEWTADTTGPPPFPWSIESSATERASEALDDVAADSADAAAPPDAEAPPDGAHESEDRPAEERLELMPGLQVCFTGSAVQAVAGSVGRSGLDDLAARHGLVPCRSVSAMSHGLLVAADPWRRSGKIDKARSLGIPIASLDRFLEALETGRAVVVAPTPNDETPATTGVSSDHRGS